MRGTYATTGVPFIDPNTNQPTVFCVSGDPIRATDGSAGWVDGQAGAVPGERRMIMSMGPFTLASGDTQQLVVACIGSQGVDRFSSITALRSDVKTVQAAFTYLSPGRTLPGMSCSVMTDTTHAIVSCRIDARKTSLIGASLQFSTYGGGKFATVTLMDDGSHDDGVAGNGIWGGTMDVSSRPSALKADAHLAYADGQSEVWRNVAEHVTTAHLSVVSSHVASDNINSDGIPNPGEDVRFVLSMRNHSPVDLLHLRTAPADGARDQRCDIGALAGGATYVQAYRPDDPVSYLSFGVPSAYPDSTIRVALVTTDDSMNVWRDTLVFPVRPFPEKFYATPILHATGNATGSYAIRVVDPAHMKDHTYVIRGVDDAVVPGTYTLKDSTTGVVLLTSHLPPDPLGHTSPVVDGFKVLQGSIAFRDGMQQWSIPAGVRRFSPVNGYRGLGLEGFSNAGGPTDYDTTWGTIGAGRHFRFSKIGTTLAPRDCHTVLLKLAAVDNVILWDPRGAAADTNFSRAYRYLAGSTVNAARPAFAPWIMAKGDGFPYQDYNIGVPFSAWDMDVTPPRRLAVGHLENNVTAGYVDGRYWPGSSSVDNSVAWEMAFIFQSPYTNEPDPALAVNLANNATTPLMWVMTCARRLEVPWVSGDEFLITPFHVPTSLDTWIFNPSAVVGIAQANTPSSFALLQNYPNPFNPSTTIRYDLPAQSEVTIIVYDILGRAVRHLVREVQPAGAHAVLWRADNDAGLGAASGIYFYRYTAARSDRNGHYEHTMKMILLK